MTGRFTCTGVPLNKEHAQRCPHIGGVISRLNDQAVPQLYHFHYPFGALSPESPLYSNQGSFQEVEIMNQN